MDPAVLQRRLDAAKAAGNNDLVALCKLAGGWNTPESLMKLREGNAPCAKAMTELFNKSPWDRGVDMSDKTRAKQASLWAQKQLMKPDEEPAPKPKAGPKRKPS